METLNMKILTHFQKGSAKKWTRTLATEDNDVNEDFETFYDSFNNQQRKRKRLNVSSRLQRNKEIYY